MIDRYVGEIARESFEGYATLDRWTELTKAYAIQAAEDAGDIQAMRELGSSIKTPGLIAHADAERRTGHDVVAFLSIIERQVPRSAVKYLHYGLTSSDLVDTGLSISMNVYNRKLRNTVLDDLRVQLAKMWEIPGSARLGRTHGQFAEPSTLSHRASVWIATWDQIMLDKFIQPPYVKSPGPVGNSRFRNGGRMAVAISGPQSVTLRTSTQVLPRDVFTRWAGFMLRWANLCEDIAMELRLSARAEVSEFIEGGANRRVGSSSMPHKKNPIGAEQISGMARIARGYVSMINENSTLHNDRDISNSSVERVAVPDLAHIVEAMLRRTATLLAEGQWSVANMGANLSRHLPEATSAWMQTLLQKHGDLGPVEAGRVFRSVIDPEDPGLWMNALGNWLNHNRGSHEAINFTNEYNKMVQEHLGMHPWV